MKNNIKISLLVQCIFIMPAIFVASCNSGTKEDKQVNNSPVQVKILTLKTGELNTLVTIPGQLVPYNNVELYAKENSYVKSIAVDIGASVKKGDLLLTLEAPELNSQYNQAQADVNNKLAVYKGSKANYDRLYRASKVPGTISPNDLDIALAKAGADSAQWKASQSAFRQAADLLNYLVVRAPFDGVIAARNISPGAYVGPGDKTSGKPLLILQDQKKLRLTIDISEDYTGYLKDKETVGFTVRTLPGQKFTAHISRMAGGIDPQTRTEQVEMDVENLNHLLLPQMYADVALNVKNDKGGFIIPRSALVSTAERIFVIKVINQKAVWVDVKKVFENATQVTISGNIQNGDTLVTNATDEIRDGTLVKTLGL